MFTDIEERKRVEETQKAVERQLMLLVEASSKLLASPESTEVLIAIIDLAKRFIDADAYSVWRKLEDSETWQIAAMAGLSDNYGRSLTDTASVTQKLSPTALVVEDVENAPTLSGRLAAYRAEGIRSLITVPLCIHGKTAGTIVFYYRVRHRATELEVRVASALGNLAAAALGTAVLYDRETKLRQEAESAERRANFLAEVGQVLASSLNYEATLTSLVDMAVPAFSDWASVDILERGGEVRRVSVKHTDPDKIALAYEFAERFPPSETDASRVALRTGKSILVEEIPDALLAQAITEPERLRFIRDLGLKSVIIAPL